MAVMNKDGSPRKKGQYQSFPGEAGASLSFEKLATLRMPPLKDRAFLDVGCNEGFFCGYAQFMGASRVVGLDMSAHFLERARARFPQCEFLNQTWDTLPEGSFDVILLASALHYAADQAELISRLVGKLTPEGTLVLELGIVSSPDNDWIPITRSIDKRFFPTWSKITEVLEPYAWKYVGKSVMQTGDPVGRYVLHIRRRRPVAYLLMLPSSYGKTAISRGLFPKAGVPIAAGDVLLDDLALGKRAVGTPLQEFVSRTYVKGEAARVVREIFAADLGNAYIDAWMPASPESDFAFDGFIPSTYHQQVVSHLSARGYLPLTMTWAAPGELIQSLEATQKAADAYEAHLRDGAMPDEPSSASPDNIVEAPKPAQAPADRKRGKSAWSKAKKAIRALTASSTITEKARLTAGQAKPSLREKWKSAGVVGVVDAVSTKGALVSIGGWAVDSKGDLPKRIVVTAAGKTFVKENLQAFARRDVKQAMLLPHPNVGFLIDVYLGHESTMQSLAEGFSVTVDDGKGGGVASLKIPPGLWTKAG